MNKTYLIVTVLIVIVFATTATLAFIPLDNHFLVVSCFLVTVLILIGCFAVYWDKRKRDNLDKLRKLNAELILARQQAEKANRMKDMFVQNMSHEIRTPLNAVMGFSQILTCPGLPVTEEEKLEYGKHIMNNVNLLTMLIDDILNISDIESGNYKISYHEEDVEQICQSAYSVVQYRVPTGVDYIFTNNLPEGFMMVTDARRIQQVLVNYLSNACKHTINGSIELLAEHDKERGFVVFKVTDTGTGVPADQAHNIFERFTKLDNFVQGTGLGLNICRSISRKMKGRVWLDTQYKDGARFCFEIPDNLKL